MRRFLALFLSVIMLFSFIPNKVESASYLKDIDAFFGGFQLKVGGKRVSNHKEPFLYDGDIFVSLSDLARGLDMNVNIKGDRVNLGSKGKLVFDSGAKETLVFQRGYEIAAKERLAEALKNEIDILEGRKYNSDSNVLKGDVKNIKVGFAGISIYLDGKKLVLDISPLKYRDDVFVPIESIAPYLYITPSLSKDKTSIDVNANGILLENSIYSSINELLSMREGRNYLLDIQRAELERRKYVLEDLKLPFRKISSIKSLESYLKNNFSLVGGLEVDFEVTKQSNWVNLDIKFPANKNHLWNKLKRSDVEQWMWHIYTAIINLYDENALMSGMIRNPYYSSYSNYYLHNYVTFYTKDNDIYFDFSKSKLAADSRVNSNHLVEHLKDKLPRYYNIGINYEAKVTGDNLDLKIYPNSNDFRTMAIYAKMGYLKSLNQYIRNLYPELTIEGEIIYPDKANSLDFYVHENRIRSDALMQETNKHLNEGFSILLANNYLYRLEYSLTETDLKNFNLHVAGDFAVNDHVWLLGGDLAKERLNEVIHRVLNYVATIWDANVIAEVVDKNGVFIDEYKVLQENVSLVYSTFPPGKVSEGTVVHLYTTTPDAKIYYTLDGSTPTLSSFPYEGRGIMITKDMTINAMGYRDGYGTGDVCSFIYSITKNENLSKGLSDLKINNGSLILSPVFSTDQPVYDLSVGSNVGSITITPYATSGVIKVGTKQLSSGQSEVISLVSGKNTINISVKEENKTEKVYTIFVDKSTNGNVSGFSVDKHRFDLLFGNLVFGGKIVNANVSDFSNYKIKLLTGSNKILKENITVSKDGVFSFTGSLDQFDTLFGFKYVVVDNFGKEVFSDTIK